MKDHPTFKDLVSLNIKYLEYVREKTYIIHQYIKNVNDSGGEVENEIRNLLGSFLPSRYKVTHGYILSAKNQTDEPLVSPQVDVIIVDTLVPHSIFVFDDKTGMEVVPVESVIGLFEVKRTLDKTSLLGTSNKKGAIRHLYDIVNSVGVEKNNSDRYLPGGLQIGGAISGGNATNPIVGILGIDHAETLYSQDKAGHIEHIQAEAGNTINPLDIIGSMNGFMYALADNIPPYNFKIVNPRQEDREYQYKLIFENQVQSKTYIAARILGYVLAYVQNCCGRKADVESYFFNRNL